MLDTHHLVTKLSLTLAALERNGSAKYVGIREVALGLHRIKLLQNSVLKIDELQARAISSFAPALFGSDSLPDTG